MIDFTNEELNLICLYDPGTLQGLIRELELMIQALMPDERKLRRLANRTLRKLEDLSEQEYILLRELIAPSFDGMAFDVMTEIYDMED